MDSHGYLGSISRVDLMIKGDRYNRRTRLYSNISVHENVSFSPRSVFNLVSGTYNKLSAEISLLSLGVR